MCYLCPIYHLWLKSHDYTTSQSCYHGCRLFMYSSSCLASCGDLSICSSSSLFPNLPLSDWHTLLFTLRLLSVHVASRSNCSALLLLPRRCFTTFCLYLQRSLFQPCILAVCHSLPSAFHPLSPSCFPPEPHPSPPTVLCLFALRDIQVGWTSVSHSMLFGGLSVEQR